MGGKGIGYGHYYRLLSIAKALEVDLINAQVFFVVNSDLESLVKSNGHSCIISNDFASDFKLLSIGESDVFVLDSYLAKDSYLLKIKKHCKLVLIDDNNDVYNSLIPDVIVNGNFHANSLNYKVTNNQELLLGPKYLTMREEYSTKIETKTENDILITTGGTDDDEVSLELLKVLQKTRLRIKIIIGPAFKDTLVEKLKNSIVNELTTLIYRPVSLKDHIDSSRLVVTAGGSTTYEVLARNKPLIVFSIADNQDRICDYLEKNGVAFIGKFPNINYIDLKRVIENDIQKYEKKFIELYRAVDGKGALRVAIRLSAL